MEAVFAGEEHGYVYRRYESPTVDAFERAMATLEGGEAAFAVASGMAAIHAALLGAGVRTGRHVVAAADCYGATYSLLSTLFAEQGVAVHFVDITNLEEVTLAVETWRPAALLIETVSNPLLKVAHIGALAERAHSGGAALIVDNTFPTPYLCQPLALGADYSVHSASKYIGGHGDVLAGVVVTSAANRQRLFTLEKLIGAVLAPEVAWLALRGLKTLPLRMERHCQNALVVARWLAEHPAVAKVNYPGLPTHPQHELAAELFAGRGFGGMISFELKAGDTGRGFPLPGRAATGSPRHNLGGRVFAGALPGDGQPPGCPARRAGAPGDWGRAAAPVDWN